MVAIGKGGVHLVHRHRVHARHLVLLLPLHPSVLEPDLYLPLRQAERVRYLDPDQVDFTLFNVFQIFRIFRIFFVSFSIGGLPASACEISVKVELLF